MTIRAVIADDEPLQRRLLLNLLQQAWPELQVVAEAEHGLEAVEYVNAHRPELVFLDIRMPGLSGLEVAGRIADRCLLVFVTAYDEFAIKAFECEAVDYLLKPLDKLRLAQTVARLQARLRQGDESEGQLQRLLQKLEERPTARYLKWIRASQGEVLQLIAVEQVIYFSAGDKYTTLHTEQGAYLIKRPLKQLQRELEPEHFWRIHRGVILNVNYLESARRELGGRYRLSLKGCDERLIVSRAYAPLFKQM